MNAALLPVIVENRGRELATRIAINTRVVDEEVAGNIFGQPALNISHWCLNDGRSVWWFQVSQGEGLHKKPFSCCFVDRSWR